jgi:hypothetical protein
VVHIFVLLSRVFWTLAFDIFSIAFVFRDLSFHIVEEGSYLALNSSDLVGCMHSNVITITSLVRQVLFKFCVM